MMKITVITVCYNSAQTIENAIRSVIFQDYGDLEYIIIDGGSTDGTLEIVDKYRDRIALCVSEPDFGIYDAMNKGLRKASGDVVAFLNSDDWYITDINVLKKVEKYFQESKADIVSGNIYIWKNGARSKVFRKDLTDETIFFEVPCPHPALFVKRELYLKFGGFDTSYKIAADTKWIIHAYINGADVLCVEDYFACFRDGGISTTNQYEALKEQYEIVLGYLREKQLTKLEKKANSYYTRALKGLETEKYVEIALKENNAKVQNLFDYDKKYYIWGAGIRGRRCLQIFEKLRLPVIGFIDSNKKQESEEGYPIIRPENIDTESYLCITPRDYEDQIKAELKQSGVEMERVITYSSLVEKIRQIGISSHILTEES
ncbi:MAG: glycosyltransferase [Hungatella sp.]|nr:glycosyltransferase [Hungatella sp.]